MHTYVCRDACACTQVGVREKQDLFLSYHVGIGAQTQFAEPSFDPCLPTLLLTWTLLQNSVLLETLSLLRRLYLWVERTTTLTSWNLAYLVTWVTCLASHLLQAAFEHTAQLAQAQEAKSQETSGPPSPQFLIPESSTTEAGPLPSQPETPGE